MMFYALNTKIDIIRTFDTLDEVKAFVALRTNECDEQWIIVDESGKVVG